jgi:hypothetical protein
MKNNLLFAVIIALSIIAHGFITRPHKFQAYPAPSKEAFSAEASRAVTAMCAKVFPVPGIKGVKIEEIRFSPDQTKVGVKYTVLMPDGQFSDWMVYQGDEFGRFTGSGRYANVEITSSL